MTLRRRLLPQTLLGRTFLLISLLILVSGSTWFTLFGLAEREPRARQLAQLTVSMVNLTNAALVAADPGKRVALLQDLADSEGVHLYPIEESDIVAPLPDTDFFAVMKQASLAQLGPRTRFASEVNGQAGIWVSFSIDDDADDDYWLMLPGEHAEPLVPWHWLGWGGASLALALLVAWLIVSRVTRPLRILANAAGELGRGRHPKPVRIYGASELQQLAAAFNRMSDDLQRIAAERTEVLAGISHDLRTPLARLRLESELSIADEAARDAVIGDIEQMDAIIAQFLDYARGDGDEPTEAIDLNALIAQVAARHGRSATPPVLDPGAIPLSFQARRKALARAVANLLDNARKYGRDPISIRTGCDGANVVIEVADCGPGIPESEIERLKRPFTRLENARTDATGTGLGLAIVERIARLHGGRFELLNRPEGGLIGRLQLPLRRE